MSIIDMPIHAFCYRNIIEISGKMHMLSLSTELMSRCRRILPECSKFDSDETLRTVFAVKDLALFQRDLREAHSPEDRVDKLITFLIRKKTKTGHFAFVIFLETLCSHVSDSDDLYDQLHELCIDVELEYMLQENTILQISNDTALMPFAGPGKQPNELMEIARHLLMHHHMKDSNVREKILAALPGEIAQSFVRNGSTSDLADTLRLIQLCAQQPEGLEKLAHTLYLVEGNSPQWQVLDKLLLRVCAKVITYTRQQQLLEIITKIEWPDRTLQKAYKASAPDGWRPVRATDAHNLSALILENLANMLIQSDGTIPMLVFALYLAYRAQIQQEQAIENALNAWVNDRVKDLGLGTDLIALLHHKARTQQSCAAYYLLVTLEPNEQGFSMRAWLLDDDNNIIQNAGIEVSDQPLSLTDIPAVLDSVLEKCGDYLAEEIDKLTIEIALPNELFCEPVDHWPVDNGMALVKLGIQHKMVVRSLERTHKKRLLALWKHRWNTLQELLDGNITPTADHIPIWINGEGSDETHESLYAKLHGSPTVCLALTFVPLDGITDTGQVFDAILAAGIPIVLWPRKYTNHPLTISDLFSSFLSSENLSHIPTLVWQQRMAAAESRDEHHLGHHLVLLWDDPNRLPPTTIAMQFTMPSTKEGV